MYLLICRGGLVGEEEKGSGIGQFQVLQPKKFENWELQQASNGNNSVNDDIVNQENSASTYVYQHANDHHHPTKPAAASSSSPKSCVSTNMLDFSAKKLADHGRQQPPPDRPSSEVRDEKIIRVSRSIRSFFFF